MIADTRNTRPESDFDRRRRLARQSPYQPLVFVAIALGLGVAADRAFALGGLNGMLALPALIGWAAAWRREWFRVSTVVLLVAVAGVGGAWHHAKWRVFSQHDLGRRATTNAQPVCVEAIATDAPVRRSAPTPTPFRAIPQGEKTEVSLQVLRLRNEGRWEPAAGRVDLIVDGNLLGVHAGDRLRVFGQLRASGEPRNPGQFDYAAEARSDRRLAQLRCESPDCVTMLDGAAPIATRYSLWRVVSDARVRIENLLWRQLGPRRAPLAAAMLVGARQGLSRDTTEPYRRTGTLHVLVVSGLHVGLVVAVFYAASRLGWFPRRPTLLAIMLAIATYAMLTGARPPVVRAAALAEMMCLAALLGRNVLAINSLAAAAILVLAWNPAELFRSGTQLSFAAAATLIWFGGRELRRRPKDPMTRLLESARSWQQRLAWGGLRWAGLVLLATFAVWCVTAPLLMTRFHLLSPVAVPISLVVFPLVGVAVVSGLLLVVVGGLLPPAAPPIAWCCGRSIDGLESLVAAADAAPGGAVWLGGPSAWWTVGSYVLMIAALVFGGRPGRARRILQLGLAWIVVGAGSAMVHDHRPEQLRCSFIAVGHGCSVLVESPDGGTLLYDAGSLGSPDAAAETIAGVLWAKGIRRLDAVVLSHADVDHFNALPGLLDRFPIGGVYASRVMFEPDTELPTNRSAPAELLRVIRRHRTPLVMVAQGDRLVVGEVSVEVLHPTLAEANERDNAKSLVLAIEHARRRVLLPGDLESPGLEALTLQAPYDCDLLLAPHHGSARSDPPGFAAWSRPEWVVVSGGDQAYSAAAGATYAATGALVMRTAELGMIEVTLGEKYVSPQAFVTP
ncbi:MAG: ComEC/Rec2 family competence protein [Planctomycetota bacterium]